MLLYITLCSLLFGREERELVVLLSLSSWCFMIVLWLFLAVPWVCLHFVIVGFPGHTDYVCSMQSTLKSHTTM